MKNALGRLGGDYSSVIKVGEGGELDYQVEERDDGGADFVLVVPVSLGNVGVYKMDEEQSERQAEDLLVQFVESVSRFRDDDKKVSNIEARGRFVRKTLSKHEISAVELFHLALEKARDMEQVAEPEMVG